MKLSSLRDLDPWEWPDDCAETFLATLRNPRASTSDRLVAAELAGDFTVVNDTLANALMDVLTNPGESEDMRCMAAISLGPALEAADMADFSDPEATELDADSPISESLFQDIRERLRRVYADSSLPGRLRRCVLETSARAPLDWHPEAVRAAYDRGGEEWRATAVACMTYVGGFEAQIVEALEHSNPEVQLEAIRAAGNWGIDAAWDRVSALALAEEADKALRLAAIDAVSTIRPEEAMELLGDLADSGDDILAEAASEAIAVAGFGDDEEDGEDGDGDDFDDEFEDDPDEGFENDFDDEDDEFADEEEDDDEPRH